MMLQEDMPTKQRFNRFLKEYQERLDHYKPNTAISAMMEWLNDVTADTMLLSRTTVEKFGSCTFCTGAAYGK